MIDQNSDTKRRIADSVAIGTTVGTTIASISDIPQRRTAGGSIDNPIPMARPANGGSGEADGSPEDGPRERPSDRVRSPDTDTTPGPLDRAYIAPKRRA